MNRIVEINNSIVEKKEEMVRLREEGKIEEAFALVKEIDELKKELEVENRINEPQNRNFAPIATGQGNALEACNKAVKGMKLTDAEMSLVEKTGEDGGYLVPEEQRTQIEELKRSLNSLKQYCNVVPVTTLSGSFPVEVESNGKLIDFDEMGDIAEEDAKFAKSPYKVKTKGVLIPISKQLLQDEKANLLSYIDKHFAKRAVRSENDAIVTLMKEATQYTEGTDYKAISKALNVKLDTAIAMNAKIYTNQAGFDYLDSLEDSNGRPLLQPNLADGTKLTFKGYEIVKLNDSEYGNDTKKLEFWVGDLSSYCNFYDRRTLEIAVSEEAGFKQYSVFTRAVERFDVGKVDAKAGVRVIIPEPSTASAKE